MTNMVIFQMVGFNMADKFSKDVRSRIMSNIRSKNTLPELLLKDNMKGLYFRYQPKVFGNPDFANKKLKIAIFVDGCFWHKCPLCYSQPKTNEEYWIKKIGKNVEKDIYITNALKEKCWIVLRFWEHEILSDVKQCVNRIEHEVKKRIENI